MSDIRVAVIGGGNMGKNHLRTFANMEGVSIVGLADINPKAKALADQYEVDYFSDYVSMLEETKPDAVSVVVPTSLHHKVGLDVISRGINCLLEKPIANTIDEANDIIEAAKRHKIVLAIGHIERFNPMVQKLRQIIKNGEIGDVTSVIARRVGGFPAAEPKTDVVIDLAVHDIDVISYLLDRQPHQVHGHGSKTLHSSEMDSAELLLDYGGASGFVQANWITPVKVRSIAVTGTKGYVEGNYITQEVTYYKHSMVPKYDGFKNFVVSLGEPEKYYHAEAPKEPLAIELRAFIDRIKGDKMAEIVQPSTARDALDVALRATKAIFRESEATNEEER